MTDFTTPNDPGDSIIMGWIRDVCLPYRNNACLIWPFARLRDGYGSFGREEKNIRAHRYICTLVKGEPPTPEHHAAHSCGRGHDACVSPLHLDWKTPSENFLEGQSHPHGMTASDLETFRASRGPAMTIPEQDKHELSPDIKRAMEMRRNASAEGPFDEVLTKQRDTAIPEQAVEAVHRKLRELFGAVSAHVAEELTRIVLTTAALPLMGVEQTEWKEKAREMRHAIDMIEGALMGWPELLDLPESCSLDENDSAELGLEVKITWGQLRRLLTSLEDCTRIINSDDYTIDALSAAPAPQRAEGEWQPIETAPKDRSWILVWDGDDIDDHKWSRCAVVQWRERGRNLSAGPGWFDDRIFPVYGATHWRPLPAPPLVADKCEVKS